MSMKLCVELELRRAVKVVSPMSTMTCIIVLEWGLDVCQRMDGDGGVPIRLLCRRTVVLAKHFNGEEAFAHFFVPP
jgi:hypothetical protein